MFGIQIHDDLMCVRRNDGLSRTLSIPWDIRPISKRNRKEYVYCVNIPSGDLESLYQTLHTNYRKYRRYAECAVGLLLSNSSNKYGSQLD